MKCACALVALVAVAAVAGAQESKSAAQKPSDSAQKASEGAGTQGKPAGWTAAGEHKAEELAAKIRASGMACTGYGPAPYGFVDEDSQRRLPPVTASTSCETDDDGDVTFEVFESAAHARQFIDTKQAFLCKRADDYGLEHFPGFPYVTADNWVVEPDDKGTADKLAPILGGKADMASCEKK